MRHLPQKQLFRINNPINNKKVDDSSINKEMLENGLATYYRFKNNAVDTEDPTDDDLVDDGIAYNKFRLENYAVPIEDSPFSADYRAGDLYRLQNPNSMTEPSRTVYSKLLVQKIRQYYLMNPQYHLAYYDVSAESPSGDPTPSAVFSEIVRQVYTPELIKTVIAETTPIVVAESEPINTPIQVIKTIEETTTQTKETISEITKSTEQAEPIVQTEQTNQQTSAEIKSKINVNKIFSDINISDENISVYQNKIKNVHIPPPVLNNNISDEVILENFEVEYNAFIEMLKEQKNINSNNNI
jgi:hypothetical protein